MANNILSSQQISALYREVAKAFAEEGIGQLSVDLNNLKSQIQLILNNIKLMPYQIKNRTYYTLYNASPKRQALAARGYILIFKFREWLLNEKLNYRYYYTDSEGNIRSTEMTEANIMNFIRFGKQGIQINPSQAKQAASASEIYDKTLNQYYKQYMALEANGKGWYMQQASGGYGFLVRSRIMNLYGIMNPGLRKNDRQYQLFNKGHILEALDTALSDIVVHDQEITNNIMEAYVFGKHLQLDHIKASQGADNNFTKTSIKSGDADLYDFYTIRKQLEEIQKILNGNFDKEQAEKSVMRLFMHQSKYASGEEFQKTASAAVDKLFLELQKQFK